MASAFFLPMPWTSCSRSGVFSNTSRVLSPKVSTMRWAMAGPTPFSTPLPSIRTSPSSPLGWMASQLPAWNWRPNRDARPTDPRAVPVPLQKGACPFVDHRKGTGFRIFSPEHTEGSGRCLEHDIFYGDFYGYCLGHGPFSLLNKCSFYYSINFHFFDSLRGITV